jgi:Ni2+-binding GTPase involved in maturation of urease and hydrogenase
MTNATTRERLTPLVVVGGYLGAGKTTLVNHLLAGEYGVRLAVVVNDIGAVNIDVDLISAHDGDTYELTNGSSAVRSPTISTPHSPGSLHRPIRLTR